MNINGKHFLFFNKDRFHISEHNWFRVINGEPNFPIKNYESSQLPFKHPFFTVTKPSKEEIEL